MVARTVTQEAREQEFLAGLRSRRKLPLPTERKQLRMGAGVSLRQLAAVIGCSHVAIARWEGGAQPADAEQATTYARLLDEFRHLTPEEVKPDDQQPTRGQRRKSRPTSR